MKIIMIFDQIQAGLGTKDDGSLPLGLENKAVGPAIMMKPYLAQIDASVTHCIYCGTTFFFEHEDVILKKLSDVLNKAQPDIVICGPSFNYPQYSKMCAHIATYIKAHTKLHVMCAMAEENEAIIQAYKDKISILKMPKKGDSGLREALEALCLVAKKVSDDLPVSVEEYIY